MLELYASLGRVDMGPRQCVFVVILVSSVVQLTRPIFDARRRARVKEAQRTRELSLDELDLCRIAVRDMPHRTQIRITYRQPSLPI